MPSDAASKSTPHLLQSNGRRFRSWSSIPCGICDTNGMRIIAGQYRRRLLQSLPGLDLRPTTDRLRETLFDILVAARDLSGSVWLDLFAGTGAVGIEALSRGARQVYFVESSKKHARLLRENLAAFDITSGYELQEREVAKALPLLE